MKTTTVPAQITTVEDIIVGSLTLKQLLLIMTSLFLSFLFYMIIPPFAHLSLFKVFISSICIIGSGVLSFRLKQKILLEWLILIARYNIRPRYYVFTKERKDSFKETAATLKVQTEVIEDHETVISPPTSQSFFGSTIRQQLLDDPTAEILFKPKKHGGVDVSVAEVKS